MIFVCNYGSTMTSWTIWFITIEISKSSLKFDFFGLSNEDGILEQSELWSEKVRNRINSTYKYVGNGLLITSLIAYFTSKSKKLFQIASSTSVKIIFYFSYKI